MNILLLAPQPFFQVRGTPIAVKMLAEELVAMGHAVDLLVYHEGDEVNISGVTLHRIPKLPMVRNISPGPSWKKFPCDTAMFFLAMRIVAKKNIQLIHAVEESVYIAMVLHTLYRIPYIYDMDSSLAEQTVDKWKLPRLLGRLLEGMETNAIRHSAGVVAVCRALEEKARTISPGILVLRLEDFSLLEPVESGPLLRDELELSGKIILYVGNLESYQGIDLLLESFAEMKPGSQNVNLVIIGGTESDMNYYRQQAEQLGIGFKTHFAGQRAIEKLSWYLDQADILISPRTHGKNTPMKVYSYMDSGKPLIATRLPTHTQVLDDEIAVLVEPDPESMALGMRRLLEDSDRGRVLAAHARKRVEEHYSKSAFQRNLKNFYNEIQFRHSINSGAVPDSTETPAERRSIKNSN